MSGIHHHRAYHAGSGVGTVGSTIIQSRGNAYPAGQNAQGRLTLNANGSISYTSIASEDGIAPLSTWGSGIAGSWFVRITATIGSFGSGSAATGVWLPITGVDIRSGVGTSGVGTTTFTLDYSPNGGGTIARTITGNTIGFAHAPP